MGKYDNRKELEFKVNEKGCHVVTSHKEGKHGYISIKRDGKVYRAHRYIYQLKKGKIDSNLVVRHRCDNKKCINIDHLELGTQKQNVHDAIERGLTPIMSGERNGMSKISETNVLEMRNSDLTTKEISLKYNISESQVRNIRTFKSWCHVGGKQ